MKISRDLFVNCLEVTVAGLAKNEIQASSQSFIFNNGQIRTCSDSISISHPLPKELSKLNGAVRADELLGVLRKTKADEIDVTIEEVELTVTTPKLKVWVKMEADVDPDSFPVVLPEKWLTVPEGLWDACSFCQHTCRKGTDKPHLTNVLVRGNHVYSSDNLRLTSMVFSKPCSKHDILVPAVIVSQIAQVRYTKIAMTEGWGHVKDEETGTVFSFRRMEVEYKDIEPFFEMEGVGISFPPDIVNAVARAENVIDKGSPLPEVTIQIKSGILYVSASGPYARIKERFKMPAASQDLQFMINPEFLKDLITRVGLNGSASAS